MRRWLWRFLLAHILACYAFQAFMWACMLLDGEASGVPTIQAIVGTLLSPIFVPLPLLRLGPRLRPAGYISCWAVYLMALAGALLLLRGRAPRKTLASNRAAAGLCPACGYDLIGNASGVCPECGTPVERRAPRQPHETPAV